MEELTDSKFRSFAQQAGAIKSSLLNQEKVVAFLRGLNIPAGEDDQVRKLAEMIDHVKDARKDLLKHMEFLQVVYSHGWDSAKYFKEDDEPPSKRVAAAIAKAKKKYVKLIDMFPDSTRRRDVEAGTQQSDSSSTSFYTF